MNENNSRLRLRRGGPLHAYLELLRAPNLFTSMADVAMGYLFVQTTSAPDARTLALLLLASTLLYAAGVVLNDVFDFSRDVSQRPDRPLPSGRISPAVARWLGWELLLLGVAVAWLIAFLTTTGHLYPGLVGSLLAGCIVLYDAGLKRTPLGPTAMGACRMLNVLLGMSVTAAPWHAAHWMVAGGIGIYIAGVTWLARTESRESSRLHLGLATGVMMAGIALLACYGGQGREVGTQLLGRFQLLMAILGALIAWRCFRAVMEPIPLRVQMAVKQGILSLVVLDAAVCYVARGTVEAVMILLLLAPAIALGRWIHST